MIKPIHNEHDYKIALARAEELWGAKADTPEGDELDVLLVLIEHYEKKHYPMPPSDPVDAILFLMDQMIGLWINTGKENTSISKISHHPTELGDKLPYSVLHAKK